MSKIGFAEAMFAASLAGLAGLSLVYGNFVPILDPFPWPAGLTYALGWVVAAGSAELLIRRTATTGAIVVAAFSIVWALLRTPPIFNAPLSVGSWYGFCEGVSVLAGVQTLFALQCRRNQEGKGTLLGGDKALHVTRILFGGACLVFGMAHFAYAAYSLPFVPAWLPFRVPLLYATGIFHAAAGVGLIAGIFPRMAAKLEATMVTLFGLLVWIPSLFTHPAPKWAGGPQNQWSETLLNFLLAAVAWLIAESLGPSDKLRSGR